MIFDTHAHYLDKRFDEDRAELIESLKLNDVKHVVEISAAREDFDKVIEFIDKDELFYGSVGVHPSDVDKLTDNDMEYMKQLASHKKIVAIGEIGLDYHFPDDPAPDIQKEWFIKQLDVAREVKKPVVIHSRDAAADTLEIMQEYNAGEIGGVLHCFSYSPKMAEQFLKLGLYIGIDGPVTFKNGKKTKAVVEMLPLDRIVIETDSPYLSPDPLRGTRNNSMNLKYVIEEIARIKNMRPEEIEDITYDNALRMYRIKDS